MATWAINIRQTLAAAFALLALGVDVASAVAGPIDLILDGEFGSTTTTAMGRLSGGSLDIGDFNRDDIVVKTETLPLDGISRLFRLEKGPIQRILSVTKNGATFSGLTTIPPPAGLYAKDYASNAPAYSVDLKGRYISFSHSYSSTNTINVIYEYCKKPDIYVGSTSGVVVYENRGDMSFGERFITSANNRYYVSAVADRDIDGDLDVMLGFYDKPGLEYWSANGTTLTRSDPNTLISLIMGHYTTDIEFADIDGDFKLETFSSGKGDYDNYMTAFSYFERLTFKKSISSDDCNSIALGDYDNDGDLDILTAHQSGRLKLYETQPQIADIYISTTRSIEKRNPITFSLTTEMTQYNGVPISEAPQAMDIDENFLYVAFTSLHQIVKLNKSDFTVAATIGTYGTPGNSNTTFNLPSGIAVDDTYVYVADTNNHRIMRLLKSDLSYHAQIPTGTTLGSSTLNQPTGLALHNGLLICDSANSRIVKIQPTTLTFIDEFGSYGTGINQFKRPVAIVPIASSLLRSIVVVDNELHVAKRFGFSGGTYIELNQIGQSDTSGANLDQLSFPRGITADTYNGLLYIADTANKRVSIQRLSENNQVYLSTVDATYLLYAGTPKMPVSIVLDHTKLFPRFTGPVWTSPTDKATQEVQWHDFDQDGKLDILSVTNSSSRSSILKNITANGNPNFSTMWTFDTAMDAYGAAIEDFDGDERIDIAFAQKFTGEKVTLYNKAANTDSWSYLWSSIEDPNLAFNRFESLRAMAADFDDNSKIDLAVNANPMSGGTFSGIAVFQNGDSTGTKVIKVKAVAKNGLNRKTITIYYRILDDGTIGEPLGVESK